GPRMPPDRAQWVKRYPHDGGDSVMGHDAVVMAGVDGSAPSLHALDWAAAHAAKVGWRLHIVCAYALPTFAAASLDGGYATLDDAAIRDGAQAVLDEALARVDDIGVPVTSALETGDPAGVLVEASRDVCLAVVGTRGRSGFAERILGTVSSALPAHAHCPTAVVPCKEGAEPPPPITRIVIGVAGGRAGAGALNRPPGPAGLVGAELTPVPGRPRRRGPRHHGAPARPRRHGCRAARRVLARGRPRGRRHPRPRRLRGDAAGLDVAGAAAPQRLPDHGRAVAHPGRGAAADRALERGGLAVRAGRAGAAADPPRERCAAGGGRQRRSSRVQHFAPPPPLSSSLVSTGTGS